jgi:hypothetical protein
MEKKFGIDDDTGELLNCPNCDPKVISDLDIVEYLLDYAKLTREQVVSAIEKGRKNE